MIPPKKLDDQYHKVGGVYRTTVLIQKRLRELNRGAKRMVDEQPKNPIELVLAEMAHERIELVTDDEANRERSRAEVERMPGAGPTSVEIAENVSTADLESQLFAKLLKKDG
jgi:DNA-directed RNA polymerase subunit K/omega